MQDDTWFDVLDSLSCYYIYTCASFVHNSKEQHLPQVPTVSTSALSAACDTVLGFSDLRDEVSLPLHLCAITGSQRYSIGWGLVEVMFSLRADVEGTRLWTWQEGKREERQEQEWMQR